MPRGMVRNPYTGRMIKIREGETREDAIERARQRRRSRNRKKSRIRSRTRSKGKKSKSRVQSILFKKSSWTIPNAVEWLNEHGYSYEKVDVSDEYLRFRQFPPRGKMRTVTFSEEDGIKAIISFK